MDMVASIESQRALLEANMLKLKSGLQQWRTWDAEYEGLKEELHDLDEGAGTEELSKVANEFGGGLLTYKEIAEITGLASSNPRRPPYIIGLIEKRQDYVQQNIATISRQLDSAEQALDILNSQGETDATEANGDLPMSEIVEELDDDDNIISSRIQRPEDTTAGLMETLKRAGVTDIPANGSQQGTPQIAVSNAPTSRSTASTPGGATTKHTSITAKSDIDQGPFSSLESVMKPAEAHTASTTTISKPVDDALLHGSFKPGDHVFQIDDEDALLAASAVLPKDESPEDAQLRREMLRYHLNEVGNVVAEIDLLEGSDDDDEDEDIDDLQDLGDDDDELYEDEVDDEVMDDVDAVSVKSDMSEDEDEHGRRTAPAITDAYRKEMKALEARLRAGFMANAGPDVSLLDGLGQSTQTSLSVQSDTDLPVRVKSTEPKVGGMPARKGVRFAEDLDIQEFPAPVASQTPIRRPKAVDPPGEVAAPQSNGAPTSKPSRFKQARQQDVTPSMEASQDIEQAPQPILANSVLERDNVAPPSRPSGPDEYDEELQRRQLASTYYQKRNDIVRQQGGFKMTEQDRDEPLVEEMADGRTKKVSRFKAARMGREE